MLYLTLEDLLFDFFITMQEKESLLNDYYTPFIKAKLDDHTKEYKKELKELDKKLDRIKAAYINRMLKMEELENDKKQIEFRKKEIEKELKEQKQYDDMNFTLDSLMIFEDKQIIDLVSNPNTYLDLIINWIILSRKDKQKIISHYIDTVTVERINDEIKIKHVDILSSYLSRNVDNHNKYNTPLQFNLLNENKVFQ